MKEGKLKEDAKSIFLKNKNESNKCQWGQIMISKIENKNTYV